MLHFREKKINTAIDCAKINFCQAWKQQVRSSCQREINPVLWDWPLREHRCTVSCVVLIGSRGIVVYVSKAVKDQLSLLNVILTFLASVLSVVEWWIWKGEMFSTVHSRLQSDLALSLEHIFVFLGKFTLFLPRLLLFSLLFHKFPLIFQGIFLFWSIHDQKL